MRIAPKYRACAGAGWSGSPVGGTSTRAVPRRARLSRHRRAPCVRAWNDMRSWRLMRAGKPLIVDAAPTAAGQSRRSLAVTPWSVAPTPTGAMTSRVARNSLIGAQRPGTRQSWRAGSCQSSRRSRQDAEAVTRFTFLLTALSAAVAAGAFEGRGSAAYIAEASTRAVCASQSWPSSTRLTTFSRSCSSRTSNGAVCASLGALVSGQCDVARTSLDISASSPCLPALPVEVSRASAAPSGRNPGRGLARSLPANSSGRPTAADGTTTRRP
mmetsp:Transcript_65559/g.191879  ORF Transcript_65559/g.191879 Transcript_65559/m.191879 type:complete len:270 (+) Transcript_65559:1023-1832(+)